MDTQEVYTEYNRAVKRVLHYERLTAASDADYSTAVVFYCNLSSELAVTFEERFLERDPIAVALEPSFRNMSLSIASSCLVP